MATFKPAREKLVPYTARVKKWITGAGYGLIDLDGQEIFVHQSEVRGGEPLKKDQRVVFQLSSGLTGRRGLPEAHNVVPDDGKKHIPEGISDKEYEDLVSRRKLDEDLRGMFDTSFWKYPKSEETLPTSEGGLTEEALHERHIVSKEYTPYEHSISFDRKMTYDFLFLGRGWGHDLIFHVCVYLCEGQGVCLCSHMCEDALNFQKM